MSDVASARLQTERKNWRKDHPKNFTAKPMQKPDGSQNLMQWKCTIPGKEGTPWEGGVYTVILDFPPSYPLEPPIATFKDSLFHPNVFEGGQVCLSILKSAKEWAPSITIPQILIGLQDLLTTPNPKDPANSKAANVMTSNPADYTKRIRSIAQKCRPKEEDVENIE